MPFELLASEVLFKGRAFVIRRDLLKTPDGRQTKFDIIEHGGSVVLVPIDSDGNLVLVRQYRHATGQELLELPAGTLEGNEAPEVCAARELREETGLAAGSLRQIGSFFLAPGYSTEFMVVYLARDLEHAPLEADPDEFLQVETVPLKDVLDRAERGLISDAKSLAALFLARAYLAAQQQAPG
jgi:ADP-ribose pyrophosphatase